MYIYIYMYIYVNYMMCNDLYTYIHKSIFYMWYVYIYIHIRYLWSVNRSTQTWRTMSFQLSASSCYFGPWCFVWLQLWRRRFCKRGSVSLCYACYLCCMWLESPYRNNFPTVHFGDMLGVMSVDQVGVSCFFARPLTDAWTHSMVLVAFPGALWIPMPVYHAGRGVIRASRHHPLLCSAVWWDCKLAPEPVGITRIVAWDLARDPGSGFSQSQLESPAGICLWSEWSAPDLFFIKSIDLTKTVK